MANSYSQYAEKAIFSHPKLRATILSKLRMDILEYQLITFKLAMILNDYPELANVLSTIPTKLNEMILLEERLNAS